MAATAPGVANPVATDFSGYEALRAKARANDPAALHAAVRQFESLFTQMLLKSMREASLSDGTDPMTGGEQGGFYRDLFDQQMALSLASGKGLGLADALERQLGPAGAPAKTGSQNPDLRVRGADGASKDEFVSKILPEAQKAAQALGVTPAAIVAQSALETGWGSKVNGENLFNIKARGSEPSVQVATLEYSNGVAHAEQAAFRRYNSTAESFSDYARLIGSAERYAGAVNAGEDVQKFAQALQDGGYATDPQYAQKLKAIADSPEFRERLQRIANNLGVG